MHPDLLHRVDDRLSRAELSACRLDGTLFELGDAYMPADVPEGPAARALSQRALLRPGLALSGPSAAWVHGAGLDPPVRHHARPTTAKRMRLQSAHLLRIHESPLHGDDVVVLSGVAVSGIVETLCDLARGADDGEPHWLIGLGAEEPVALLRAADRLRARRRLPGKREALDRLERAYEEVTRYTS